MESQSSFIIFWVFCPHAVVVTHLPAMCLNGAVLGHPDAPDILASHFLVFLLYSWSRQEAHRS